MSRKSTILKTLLLNNKKISLKKEAKLHLKTRMILIYQRQT
jgi:hypothetical protein